MARTLAFSVVTTCVLAGLLAPPAAFADEAPAATEPVRNTCVDKVQTDAQQLLFDVEWSLKRDFMQPLRRTRRIRDAIIDFEFYWHGEQVRSCMLLSLSADRHNLEDWEFRYARPMLDDARASLERSVILVPAMVLAMNLDEEEDIDEAVLAALMPIATEARARAAAAPASDD